MTRPRTHRQTPPLTPLRRAWLIFALTGLGCCVGVLTLLYGAAAYIKLPGLALFRSYFHHPALLGLNLLPPVLLIWLFYFLTRRGWGAFLGSFLPCVAVAMVNYFKIRLRSDPFLAADLTLISEAGGIVGNYSLDVDWLTWLTLGALLAGLLFSVLLIPKWPRRGWGRAFAAASCAAVCAVSCASLFTNSDLYQSTDNSEYINPWSDVEVFVSKGCLYPFLYSMRDMFPAPPPGYDGAQAQALLGAFSDADIPADKQVSVMGIMLEAFCDLTDFDFMADHPDAARVYDPWHALAEQGVSGRLLTNIFAGGTVDSEWGFLSGYSQHDDFRRDTDSYVWYLRDQGYQTFFSHPGYGWFYNRQNVNDYLGFQDSWFTENHYGALVDPTSAIYHSDDILVLLLRVLSEPRPLRVGLFRRGGVFHPRQLRHGRRELPHLEQLSPGGGLHHPGHGPADPGTGGAGPAGGAGPLRGPQALGGQRQLRLCRYGAHLRPWHPSGVLRLLRHALSHLGQLRRQRGAGQRLHRQRRGLLPLLPHAQGL